MTKATAQAYSEPCSPPSHARRRARAPGTARAGSLRTASRFVASMRSLSGLGDRVFRQDRLDPLERVLGGFLRRHAVLDDIRHGDAPGLLRVRHAISGIEDGVGREG